jgi:hypothetical protein
VDFPEAMPPVRPMTGVSGELLRYAWEQGLTEHILFTVCVQQLLWMCKTKRSLSWSSSGNVSSAISGVEACLVQA